MKNYKILICFLIAIFYFSFNGYMQTVGSLDISFGNAGSVITDFNNYDDWGYSVAVQDDGKIVVAGESGNVSNYDFGIVRFNEDGTYDNSFGSAGKVSTAIGGSDDIAYAMGIQSDGKIVVAGTTSGASSSDAALVRYNSNGTLDNTFGSVGIVTKDISVSDDYITSLAIQQDGKIVLAGYSFGTTYYTFVVLRYNSNGTIDSTFGTGGVAFADIGNSDNGALAIALQSDQKIVVAGWSNNGAVMDYDFAIARFNTNGTIDPSFGTGGYVITSVGTSMNEISDIAIQTDGKIVVAGTSSNVWNDFAVVRYNSDGTLDNSFGSGGIVITDIGGSSDVANAIVIQPDGKIIVAGYAHNGSTYNNTAIVRYCLNGIIDNTFGTNGKTITTIGTWDNGASATELQVDGKIITAGWTANGGDNEISVVRFIGSGTLDDNFYSKKFGFSFFPNPNEGQFTIDFTSITPVETQIEIYNINNKKVYSSYINEESADIDLTGYAKGLYFVKMSNEKWVKTGKIMIN
jgi:uncharacterized delta-60 repeat protein